MKSLWSETPLPRFPALSGDAHTDVLIIGGGIAGILAAYMLEKAGVKYMLIEKDAICSGTTQNTTAKITYQHGLIYRKIMRAYGVETAKKFLCAHSAAFDEFARLCRDIECDYEIKDNYVYSLADRKKLEEEMAALDVIGCRAEFCEDVPLPIKTAGAVKIPGQAQFHPLKFIAGISKGLNIYENTYVREMIGNTARTDGGRIYAERVIAATHFPFINKHGAYFIKMYQHRSYVLALAGAEDVSGMYVDEADGGYSFRNYGDLLLLGGAGARTGTRCGAWEELRKLARSAYPAAQEKYHWAAQDCMSLDGMAYIGRYGKTTKNFYVASGFNKWGMTGAMTSAMILRDIIIGKNNEYADIFSPHRRILHPQLLYNGAEAVKDLLTLSDKRCPHLGCALKWNRAERSWDCPCHGSRFSPDGKVLDNPANADMKK